MDNLALLERLNVVNYDNGLYFTDTSRLEAIEECLRENGSPYRLRNDGGLFALYSRVPIEELEQAVVISTHVDCVPEITKPFSKEADGGLLLGTYDNSITNAAALAAMLCGTLPDNVLIAFTGDEENGGHGAADVCRFLSGKYSIRFFAIVTDVTGEAYYENADFTVENDFMDENQARAAVTAAQSTGLCWRFVPEDTSNIPSCVPRQVLIPHESMADESWEYDEHGISCFSLCIPTSGEMHSNSGVTVRKESYFNYIKALGSIAAELSLSLEP